MFEKETPLPFEDREEGLTLGELPIQKEVALWEKEEERKREKREESKKRMNRERLMKGKQLLQEYRAAKMPLDERIVENNRWWEMRHWDGMTGGERPEQKSGWLLNSLLHKHADAMDNYPEANVLPREEGDKKTAQILSSVLPTVLEQNDFEEVYSVAWWDKLKSGTAVYGVYWNQDKARGLGDVEITNIDLLGLFWEPGVRDIQKSENLFYCTLVNHEKLKTLYPQLQNKGLGGNEYSLSRYNSQQMMKDHEKSTLVDWYYKTEEGLHYCKFVGDTVLYASEDDPDYQQGDYYQDGNYPFVLDVLFPIEGSPVGFGYIDTMKDVQERIDKVGSGITKNAYLRSKSRYWVKDGAGVNEEEFADFDKDFVHITGNNIQESVGQIHIDPIGGDVTAIYTHWIDELKETSGNRDVSQGGTQRGVTAASAIAALQEAASKLTRDMLKTAYRSYQKICYMVIERLAQFYDSPRTYRIIGSGGEYDYQTFDQGLLAMEEEDTFGFISQRKPIFDIKIAPQKSSPYTKIAQNELALNFYDRGFFSPQNADQALSCLEMMDFDGKEKLIGRIEQNEKLAKMVEELQQSNLQLAQLVEQLTPGTGVMEETAKNIQGQRGGSALAGGINPMGGMMGNPRGALLGGELQEGQEPFKKEGREGRRPQEKKGGKAFIKTDGLGREQSANDSAARMRRKVAHFSDPNGGQP